MEKYQILEHKADFKIKAFGKTKEELFLNMLLGMNEGLKPEVKQEKAEREVKIKSIDLPALLVDFLSEVLYLVQVNREVYNNIRFKKLSNTELEAELTGKKVERFNEDIKAVTHHGLEVQQIKDNIWEAVIIFDT